MEACGGCGVGGRRLVLSKRVAQQREGLIADGRRDIGARLELLDARFDALDGAVGGFDRFVATRGRCGTRAGTAAFAAEFVWAAPGVCAGGAAFSAGATAFAAGATVSGAAGA